MFFNFIPFPRSWKEALQCVHRIVCFCANWKSKIFLTTICEVKFSQENNEESHFMTFCCLQSNVTFSDVIQGWLVKFRKVKTLNIINWYVKLITEHIEQEDVNWVAQGHTIWQWGGQLRQSQTPVFPSRAILSNPCSNFCLQNTKTHIVHRTGNT